MGLGHYRFTLVAGKLSKGARADSSVVIVLVVTNGKYTHTLHTHILNQLWQCCRVTWVQTQNPSGHVIIPQLR